MGYGENGKWRKARKDHTCDYYLGKDGTCRYPIPAGTMYFDTMESNEAAGGYGTDRICPDCFELTRPYRTAKGE